jgi:hypothetical protein
MATVKSPATILRLLNRAKTTYQKEKPDANSAPEKRHKPIVDGLKRLTEMARKKASGADLRKPFLARKRLLLKGMTEHRKKLSSSGEKAADANKAQLPAYLKALIRLTRGVLALDWPTVIEGEEEVNLDALEEGNVAELDSLDQISDADLKELEAQDIDQRPTAGEPQTQASAPGGLLDEWQAARELTVGELRKLAAAIAAEKEADSAKAVILVSSIIKNLTPSPSTRQSVTELQRYLQTDDVITRAEVPNPFDIPIVIRERLLPVLERLQKRLPA